MTRSRPGAASSRRRSSAIPEFAAEYLTLQAREDGHDEGAIERLLGDDPELNDVWRWIAKRSDDPTKVALIAQAFVVSALQARGWSKLPAATQAEMRQDAKDGPPPLRKPWQLNPDRIFKSRKSGVQTVYLRALLEHLRSHMRGMHLPEYEQEHGAAVVIAALASKVLGFNIDSKLVSGLLKENR